MDPEQEREWEALKRKWREQERAEERPVLGILIAVIFCTAFWGAVGWLAWTYATGGMYWAW